MTAREFAIKAHGDQRYGQLPYESHLRDVVLVMLRFGVTDPALADAAWLHDVIEDCAVRSQTLIDKFGEDVGDVVWAVSGFGNNRAARNADAYRKIGNYGKRAVILKLADRIANMEHSIATGTSHLEMYRREFPAFEAALYRAGEAD
jgi:(p)ppGpp synthase/HD superfamily hydrolase